LEAQTIGPSSWKLLLLEIGGQKTCPPKAQKCSYCVRDSNTSNKGYKSGIKMSLTTFLNPKEKWKENYMKLIKFSSRDDSQIKGKGKRLSATGMGQ